MANCVNCVHIKVCQKTRILNPANNLAEDCTEYKDISLFVELPLKVGDTFFTFNYDEDAISKQTIEEIRIIDDIDGDNIVFYGQCVVFTLREIGTFTFLTYEEAEQALAEKKRGI